MKLHAEYVLTVCWMYREKAADECLPGKTETYHVYFWDRNTLATLTTTTATFDTQRRIAQKYIR